MCSFLCVSRVSDHWRRNLPVLAQSHRVFAIDLLGYGYSDKPDPKGQPANSLYTVDTWSRQARAFLEEVVGAPAFLICNSVGGARPHSRSQLHSFSFSFEFDSREEG